MPLVPQEKKRLRIFLALCLFHLILISFQVPLGVRPSLMEKAFFGLVTPVHHGLSAVFRFMGGIWRVYFYHRNVELQNRDLRRESFDLKQENASLKRELESLRSRTKIEESLSANVGTVRAASIISWDPLLSQGMVVIDLGLAAGVRPNMAVLDRDGQLVGRVVEPVTWGQASVQLMTHVDSGVGAVVEGEKGVGVLGGDEQGGCRLKYILSTTEGLQVGDRVFSSGYDGIFPRGLPLGRIERFGRDDGLFKTIIVRPYFRIERLEPVAVLLEKTNGESERGEGSR